jgi:LytS/YehU family sensor histidine kinase
LRSGATLQVRVTDDGVGFQGHGGSGIGLANVRARLRALYGSTGRLLLEANEPRGVRATLIVPLGSGA